jgi:hypothetical protein
MENIHIHSLVRIASSFPIHLCFYIYIWCNNIFIIVYFSLSFSVCLSLILFVLDAYNIMRVYTSIVYVGERMHIKIGWCWIFIWYFVKYVTNKRNNNNNRNVLNWWKANELYFGCFDWRCAFVLRGFICLLFSIF